MKSQKLHVAALTLCAAALFIVNIHGYELWAPDEPRFGQVAREMLETGDLIVLQVNGAPYEEKPPLLFWAIAALSLPRGDVTEFSARLPSVLSGVVTVLLTFLLGARLYGRRAGWWSAIILMTTAFFWWQARTAQIDMLLTACLTGALYCFDRWRGDPRARWLIAFYACTVLAVYAKGPVGYLLPVLLVVAFYWRRPEERRRVHLLAGTAAVAVLILLWLIPARMGMASSVTPPPQESLGANLFRQTIGRFILGVSKAQWPWYYLFRLPVNLLPWSLFLPWALPWLWRRRREGPEMRLLLSWTVPALVFFTISVGKREQYLLPLYPAFAILTARAVLEFVESGRLAWVRTVGAVWGLFLALVGAAPFALLLTEYRDAWDRSLLLFALPAFGFAADAFHRAAVGRVRSLHVLMAMHFTGLSLLCALFVFPVVNGFKSARGFCEPVRVLAEAKVPLRLYSSGFSREEYIFYARHPHEAVFTDLLTLGVAEDADPRRMVRIQRAMRKAVAQAVAKVPVADFDRVTDEEFAALRAAALASMEETGEALPLAFEKALLEAIDAFADRFEAGTPAFVFVQTDDWRWMLPLRETMRGYTVLRHSRVGRREVLLIANAAAVAAYEQRAGDAGDARLVLD